MKTLAIVATSVLLTAGFTVPAQAYEGGTKAVAAFTNPEVRPTQYAPIVMMSHDELAPSKPMVGLLRRIPEPTLSVKRLREEAPGRSLGTKSVVLFQKSR